VPNTFGTDEQIAPQEHWLRSAGDCPAFPAIIEVESLSAGRAHPLISRPELPTRVSFFLRADVIENVLEIVRRDRECCIPTLPSERPGSKLFTDGAAASRLYNSHEIGHGHCGPECRNQVHVILDAPDTENPAVRIAGLDAESRIKHILHRWSDQGLTVMSPRYDVIAETGVGHNPQSVVPEMSRGGCFKDTFLSLS